MEGYDYESLGPLETLGPCTPINIFYFFDFVLILVHIVAAVIVLIRAKDEHPPAELFSWIIMYTCLCIAILPILYWRFWEYSPWGHSYISTNRVVDILKKSLEHLLATLFVLFLCVLIGGSLSLHENYNHHFWLSMVFLAYCFIRYVLFRLTYTVLISVTVVGMLEEVIPEAISHNLILIVSMLACIGSWIYVGCKQYRRIIRYDDLLDNQLHRLLQ